MDSQPRPEPTLGRRARQIGLIVAGSLFLALGMVGIVIPVLPTTPFLLLAAVCYGRSSERTHRWLVTNRVFGRYLDDYLRGRGMPRRAKAFALILLWGTITLSAVLFVSQWWLRAFLFALAVGVTVYILALKGQNRKRIPEC
jgi:uncharacterized membrane protein YbaN (DUF454 family)